MSIDVSGIKEGQKTMWTAGDYPEVAQRIAAVGEHVVERAGAGPGVELLDVATGSGNVAIPAALAGRRGDRARPDAEAARGAARAGAPTPASRSTFVEGDAEELPFGDASFDRVTSCFGVMFAPRHDGRRGASSSGSPRPARRIVVAGWTPEGWSGGMFQHGRLLHAAAARRASSRR